MVVTFPCGICQKTVGMKLKAICCHFCNMWINIACKKRNKKHITIYKIQLQTAIVWPVLKKRCLVFLKQTMNSGMNIWTDHIYMNIWTVYMNRQYIWTDHTYSGKHIIPFKSKDIETFTTQINNWINENSEKKSQKPLCITIWMNLKILSYKITISFNEYKYFISKISYWGTWWSFKHIKNKVQCCWDNWK